MTTETIECLHCFKKTTYENGEDDCGEYSDLRNKQRWELVPTWGVVAVCPE